MPFINRCGGGGSAKLQSKTVKSTTSKQTVSPDSGYDGFSSVTVSPIKLQAKSVSPLTTSAKVFPDAGYDGLSQVTVNAMDLVSKTVTPTNEKQTVLPGAGYDGLSSVVVNAAPLETKNITQTGTFTPSSGKIGFSKVTVNDSNLVAANIKKGVSIFGVTGALDSGGPCGSVKASGTYENTLNIEDVPSDWAECILIYKPSTLGVSLPSAADKNIVGIIAGRYGDGSIGCHFVMALTKDGYEYYSESKATGVNISFSQNRISINVSTSSTFSLISEHGSDTRYEYIVVAGGDSSSSSSTDPAPSSPETTI